MLWFVVLEMSVHDAWPCFLWHRGEEVHCGMKRGESSPHGSQEGKRGPESAHLLESTPTRDSPFFNWDPPLSVRWALNSATDQFFNQ